MERKKLSRKIKVRRGGEGERVGKKCPWKSSAHKTQQLLFLLLLGNKLLLKSTSFSAFIKMKCSSGGAGKIKSDRSVQKFINYY